MLKSDDQSIHRTTAFVEYLETPPSTNGIYSFLGFFAAGTILNLAICSICHCRCSTWSFATFRSQSETAASLAWEREQTYCYFPGQKHLPYGTGDNTKNSGTVLDVSGHLANLSQYNYDVVN